MNQQELIQKELSDFKSNLTISTFDGFDTEIEKRLTQCEFYQNAKRKSQIKDRIIRHASIVYSIQHISNCKMYGVSFNGDWNKYYRGDNKLGFRPISRKFLEGVCGTGSATNQLLEVLSKDLDTTIVSKVSNQGESVCGESKSNHTNTTKRGKLKEIPSIIVSKVSNQGESVCGQECGGESKSNHTNTTKRGKLKEIPSIIVSKVSKSIFEMKKNGSGGRANNIFRINPYFLNRRHTDRIVDLKESDIKHITAQKIFAIDNYGMGLDVNYIEYKNLKNITLVSLDDARDFVIPMIGDDFRGEEITIQTIEEWMTKYEECYTSLVGIDTEPWKVSKKVGSLDRHYTPFQRIPAPIRNHILTLNRRVGVDVKSMHPNLLNALYNGSTTLADIIGYVVDDEVISFIDNYSREYDLNDSDFMKLMTGDVKRNLYNFLLSIGETQYTLVDIKIEFLSFFNKKISQAKESFLYPIFEEYAPDFLQFMNWIRSNNHKRMSDILFKLESTIMDKVIIYCDMNGIEVNGVHDEVVVDGERVDEVVAFCTRTLHEYGLDTDVSYERIEMKDNLLEFKQTIEIAPRESVYAENGIQITYEEFKEWFFKMEHHIMNDRNLDLIDDVDDIKTDDYKMKLIDIYTNMLQSYKMDTMSVKTCREVITTFLENELSSAMFYKKRLENARKLKGDK